jgi:hypothetical protein
MQSNKALVWDAAPRCGLHPTALTLVANEMKQGVSQYKLVRIAIESLKNSIRLHFDSILLFKNGSFPSAYLGNRVREQLFLILTGRNIGDNSSLIPMFPEREK